MIAPVLIFAIGNESRGDDALAPLLLRKIEHWLQSAGMAEDSFELVEEYQLQIENTLDMVERELILFMDAGIETPAPFSFSRTPTSTTPNLFSHALAPDALLALYSQIYQTDAPPSFTLCLRGEQFELGASLTTVAESRLHQTLAFMQKLLQQANLPSWQAWAEKTATISCEKEFNISASIA